MSLPRYPQYKDSGVDWLGKVPKHWEVRPLKRDLAFLTSGSRGWAEHYSDDGALFIRIGNLTRDSVRLDLTDIQRVIVPNGAEGERTKVQPGDILFSITAFLGSVAVAPEGLEPAFVSQHVALARLQEGELLPIWVAYVAFSWVGKTYLETQGYGGTKVQLGLDDVANLLLTIPPLNEQTVIATFLDSETGKIDALIAEQEKLLALLAEKRQATISHAVTKGLNPDVPMKDSGVAWLGEVPGHWVLTPLARISLERCDGPFGSGIKSEHYTDEGALVVRLQNIRAGLFNTGEPVFLDEHYFLKELRGHEVKENDLLVAGLGDDNNLLGRACVAPAGLGLALVKADCFRFRLDTERAVPEFVAWQLSAGAGYDAGVLATGTTRSRIPLSIMSSRKLGLPPVEEQTVIAAFIARENAKLDSLKAESERAIALLKERRSALIAAAVTGQIDVRSLVTPFTPSIEELTA